ncbi:hypothetical protein PHLCEN_2v7501 [Hermanssonia centrifuga]|uniref:Tyrosinase copper-binding domain-containing protein n=1 Tax=Hermanssonia centrifuga TaxID=98765 RepID=A0A2R6NW87_9APHY|nr:hypothetical protein PHLCEN_2v7501 [Hermanssonia centrifuga]
MAEKALWHQAARELRFPYWDWSAVQVETDGLPKIFSEAQVTVTVPKNATTTLKNPLMSYTLHPIPVGAPDYSDGQLSVYFAEWVRTYRWASGERNPRENYTELNSWDYFSNTDPKAPPPPDAASLTSLEEPHNQIHLDIGGGGDMAYNEMAAFDPMFFFHHCNVDRLYALWEYVYPDYWIGNGYYDANGGLTPFRESPPLCGSGWKLNHRVFPEDPSGTYQEDPNTSISETSGLPPFRKDSNNYWVTKDVRGLQPSQGLTKYYTYDPLTLPVSDGTSNVVKQVTIDVTKPSTLEERTEYIAALHQYYGGNTVQLRDTTNLVAKPALFNHPVTDVPDTHQVVDGYRDFVIVVLLSQYAFRGSHRLELFLDGVLVGNVSVFSRINPANCEACVARIASGDAKTRGIITIPHALVVQVLEKYGLNKETTTDEEIVALLKKHIVAKIVNPIGSALAHASHGHVTASPGSHLPELKEEHRPNLRFHSTRVLVSAPGGTAPPQSVGWIDHGEVLGGEWRHATVQPISE